MSLGLAAMAWRLITFVEFSLLAALRRRWHVRLRAHELHLRLLEERCPLGG
jgi:hypothetical protein